MIEIERPKIDTAEPQSQTAVTANLSWSRWSAVSAPRLGNSLRRVLLSSLPGVAVTSVKIDGVSA